MEIIERNVTEFKADDKLIFGGNNVTNVTSSKVDTEEEPLSNALIWALFLVGILELILNAAILMTLVTHKWQQGGRTLKQQFVAITINDLITAIVTMLMAAIELPPIKHSVKLCAVVVLSFITAQLASILTVLMIGIKRFIVVRNIRNINKEAGPTNRNPKAIALLVVGIWLFSAMIYIVFFVPLSVRTEYIESCYFKTLLESNLQKFGALITMASLISLVLVDGVYTFTILFLKRAISKGDDSTNTDGPKDETGESSKGRVFALNSRANSANKLIVGVKCAKNTEASDAQGNDSLKLPKMGAPATEGNKLTTHSKPVLEKRRRKVQLRSLITLGLILMAVNVSTLPFVIVGLLKAVISIDVSKSATIGFSACMSLNALLDPFVYCLRVSEVREKLLKTLAWLCCGVFRKTRPTE